MPHDDRKEMFTGLRITGVATLASRLLGMVRDIATAALFGLASGGVLDAFVVAFRIPSLLRRLFGEGALTASYLPVITSRLVEDRRDAWQLVSVMLTWLTVILCGVVLLGEALCWLAGWRWADTAGIPLVTGLAATLMPYVLFVCLTALLATTLQALSHFTAPALAPVALNICWLLGVWVVAPRLAPDKEAQAYALAVCVVVAGVVQLIIQWPPLWRRGFRFDYNWERNRTAVRSIVMGLGPTLFGLAVTQLNTLADILIAWCLSATPDGRPTVAWLGDAVGYPMSQGAAAAIYYGERLYQFPLGILGVTVATVIFPSLSRHAVPAITPRRGRRPDTRPPPGMVHGPASQSGAGPAGPADRSAPVSARRVHCRRRAPDGPDDRLLRGRCVGLLRPAAAHPRILCPR